MAEDPKDILRRAIAKQKADAEALAQTTAEKARKQREYERERRRLGQPPNEGNESEAALWVRENFEWEEYAELWVPSNCSWSDYSGGIVEQSNGKALQRDYPEIFSESTGGHGTVWVGIEEEKRLLLSDEEWESIQDPIEGLADYPVIDDDLHSEMEMEQKSKDWTEYHREEIREALLKKFSQNVNAQIGVLTRNNEFWDIMFREKEWDEYQVEETGGNFAFYEERAAAKVDSDEVIDDDLVESAKKAVFMKDGAGPLGALLRAEGIDYRDDQHLWDMVRYIEDVIGPEALWEADQRVHVSGNDEVDPTDYITFFEGEAAEALAGPNVMQKMLNKHWADDPRQLKLPLESKAQALAMALLEDVEDPKSVMAQLPRFKFKTTSFQGDQVFLQSEEGSDWPIPLGCVTSDPDGLYRIILGAPTRLGWKWWEQVAPEVFERQFPDRDAAAKELWLLWKRSGALREAEDPKSVFRQFSRSDNFWGPKWTKDESGAWRAKPTSNRIYIIDPFSQGYCLTELWRGAMTGKWKEVYRKCFKTPEEVRAHFPLRLREAEDPKEFLLSRTPTGAPRRYIGNMPKEIEIWGRRWFSRTYGNTYFTARIYVDGQLVHTMPEEYGYGQQYMDRSFEWLEENGYVPLRPRSERGNVPDAPWSWCEKHGIRFTYHAEDIRLRRHRFTEAEDPKNTLRSVGQQQMQRAERLRPGDRVIVHHRAQDVVDMGQTGVVSALPEPGWAEVELDDPRYSENNYPFRLAELEPI